MEAITTLVKLLAVAIATTFVGAPIGPTIEAEIPIEEQTSTEGSGSGSGGTTSNSNAANKISAAGSTIEHMCATVEAAPCTETVTLFSEAIKISDPKDLLIEVNAECALWTEVVVVDDDDSNTPEVDVPHSESEARVTVQVLLDGVPVGVNEFDNGEVVFCDRVHGMTLRENEGDNDNETVSNYLRTRSANSFSWIVLNTGDYPSTDGLNHLIEVKATLEGAVNMGEGSAEAAVGKRTLIVEPVGMKNNEQL